MSNKGAESNQQAAQRRAESYYLLYAALGRDRSLTKLRETLADLGLSVSLNTLKSYSANHDWQGRAGFLDQRNTSLEHANLPAEMNERHARLGIALQTVAGKRLETIDASELSVGDAPRLAKAGVDIARLATGQSHCYLFFEWASSAAVLNHHPECPEESGATRRAIKEYPGSIGKSHRREPEKQPLRRVTSSKSILILWSKKLLKTPASQRSIQKQTSRRNTRSTSHKQSPLGARCLCLSYLLSLLTQLPARHPQRLLVGEGKPATVGLKKPTLETPACRLSETQ